SGHGRSGRWSSGRGIRWRSSMPVWRSRPCRASLPGCNGSSRGSGRGRDATRVQPGARASATTRSWSPGTTPTTGPHPRRFARLPEFRLDATIGAPPDAFSPEGQDWGLPIIRWDVMRSGDHAWWRDRCRRAAALFDGVRLDHVLGYYRVYERPCEGPPFFDPA